MAKLIFQLLILAVLFFGGWMLLNQVNWMSLFKVNQISASAEDKLGQVFWDFYKESGKEIEDEEITIPLDSIVSKICTSNGIDRKQVKLHILKSEEINAFALPGSHLVIFSGLISSCENEAALSGVISHELAHMELNHVMKKLAKEIGLSMLLSMAGGNGSPEVVREAAKILSSSAYDRKLEREADLKAVDYMLKSGINPEPFADFLYQLPDLTKKEKQLAWLSTHPGSRERAEYIIKYSRNKTVKFSPILKAATWDKLNKRLKKL